MQKKFRLSILTLSLGLVPAIAMADTNADILKELEALKTKVQQLEAQVKTQQAQIQDNQKATEEASQVANHAAVQVTGVKSAAETSGFKGLSITGMIAPAYVYNKDQQSSSFVFLNRSNGDPAASTIYNYDNSSFGQAYIQFQKVTEGGTKWTLNLAPERGTGANMNGNSIVNEASVSMPLNGDPNTRLIAGQIPDWEGYEYVFDNQTKSITHNLLFDFTELFAYTGAGVDVTNGNLEWKALVGNVNSPRYYYNNNGTGGRAPAAIFRADYSLPGYDSAGVGFWALVGKTPNVSSTGIGVANGTSSTTMFEADGYLNKGNWGYYGQFGAGKQVGAAYNGGDAQWWGLSGMLTYNYTPRVLSYVRADYLNDSKNGGGLVGGYNGTDSLNGFGPNPVCVNSGATNCNGANRYALTLGANYLYSKSTTLKLEYRYDRANMATFVNVSDGSYTNNNSLLAASVVVSF
ncbi:MAG: DUF3138 family protein [Proteobacteria bacterium]|nr:DUF3138 family protein [Pseudomonadota bacterium]